MDFMTLFISLRCTQTCAHCLYGCTPEYGKHMSLDIFTKSIEIAKESQIPTLNFFGGEPLLNPQVFTMLQTALENDFTLMVATNCRPLAKDDFFTEFLNVTKRYKDRMVIFTPRDKFHLKFFDPAKVIKLLRRERYNVVVQYGCDHTVILSDHNVHNQELQRLNTRGSCCKLSWTDYLGVLPDGGWTICPASLEAFGNIFTESLELIIKFKRELPLRYKEGCSECLKDFKDFRKEFEKSRATKETTGRTQS